jgi:cytochrome b pre-mRNA-processing protein 3
MGLGDPTLGKKVRKLVGSLARRVDLWRQATAVEADWVRAADDSIYKGSGAADALSHSAEALRQLWTRLERSGINQLVEGRIG